MVPQSDTSHPYDWAYAKLNLQRPMVLIAAEAVLGLVLDANPRLIETIDEAAKRLAIRDRKFQQTAELLQVNLITLAKNNLLSAHFTTLLKGWDRPMTKGDKFYQVDRQALLRRPLDALKLEDLARFTLGNERIELTLEILLFTLAQKNRQVAEKIKPADSNSAFPPRPASPATMKFGTS